LVPPHPSAFNSRCPPSPPHTSPLIGESAGLGLSAILFEFFFFFLERIPGLPFSSFLLRLLPPRCVFLSCVTSIRRPPDLRRFRQWEMYVRGDDVLLIINFPLLALAPADADVPLPGVFPLLFLSTGFSRLFNPMVKPHRGFPTIPYRSRDPDSHGVVLVAPLLYLFSNDHRSFRNFSLSFPLLSELVSSLNTQCLVSCSPSKNTVRVMAPFNIFRYSFQECKNPLF